MALFSLQQIISSLGMSQTLFLFLLHYTIGQPNKWTRSTIQTFTSIYINVFPNLNPCTCFSIFFIFTLFFLVWKSNFSQSIKHLHVELEVNLIFATYKPIVYIKCTCFIFLWSCHNVIWFYKFIAFDFNLILMFTIFLFLLAYWCQHIVFGLSL
jgi:hypothetical protein